MTRYLISYDISHNKRRKRLSDVLEGYGKRVQYSVFEIEVKNSKHFTKLKTKILKEIKEKEDSVRIYKVCENCLNTSVTLGDEPEIFEKDAIYFF